MSTTSDTLAQLVNNTDQLLQSITDVKETLDEDLGTASEAAITATEEAGRAALQVVLATEQAVIANGNANTARSYRDETRSARDEAAAIVYGGDFSVDPAPGSVPISRPDSTLHPDWIAGEYSAALVGHINYAIDIASQAAGAVNGGEVRVATGAADRPSICLATNPGTGIFFPADDEIAFAINGVEVLRIDSSGIV